MIERQYSCDLCHDKHDARELVGIKWSGQLIAESPSNQTEHHLCHLCLSSLQVLPARCGQGYKCKGGPTCDSDHK